MYDVVIAGAGPAGSVVAKRCALYGLHTLILEKKKLPRDKVCGGLLSPFARLLINQEFGVIPGEIFCKPPQIAGHVFHVGKADAEKFESPEGLTWRRNLDFWMNKQAQAKGAELWQASKVTKVKDKGDSYLITIEKDGEKQDLEAKFVVGADGTDSTVRKQLFPEFQMNYLEAYSEHYPSDILDLEKAYAHLFYSLDFNAIRKTYAFFGAEFKDDVVVIHFTDRVGQVKELAKRAFDILSKDFGFDKTTKPLVKEGCLVPLAYEELTSHTFRPAKRNAILVGDAGGLNVLEGIAPSVKSAISAAEAIKAAVDKKGSADKLYLADIEVIINRIKEFSVLSERINKEMESGGKNLAKVFGEANYDSLKSY